ncbi:superoxide dismutase [Pseudenhygromyxa sp. WMMC2535]|uniref:superoxide dismutase n=1 Tax=Pseudenhygromyxa sp. WMMC2535 TaxID=2712867 RepID=UPI001554F69D|nr:superoxide dismutase [Pseudenhygromyxa sp. WMMC2535]NVB41106.1 superoxide dismutase [Pseudenhygromyxa sp. WMMC2535]
MAIELPSLPYSQDALAPHMSAETLSFHYGKHHAGYVKKLNAAIPGTQWADKSLEEIIRGAEGGIFNNAAQVWNHSFFWNCLEPGGGGEPSGDLADAINRSFGSFAEFKTKFSTTCATQFGSGWGWLVKKGDALEVMSTANADTPLKHGVTALMTIDVWEHAYYIDYRNDRAAFIAAVIDNLANWDFVASQL